MMMNDHNDDDGNIFMKIYGVSKYHISTHLT